MTISSKEQVLDLSPGRVEKNIISRLSRFVIGQERAKKRIADILLRRKTGLRDPRWPLGVIILLGPTGVGKTELIKATADFLFGSLNAYTHISCPNYQNGHEIAKLIGSPAGYVGSDKEPFLSQNNIDKHDFYRWMKEIENIEKQLTDYEESIKSVSAQSPQKKQIIKEIEFLIEKVEALKDSLKNYRFCSLILFDEFEKGHPKLHEALLEILSDGMLSLENIGGGRTNFSNAIIALTGNIASEEIKKERSGRRMGFHSDSGSAENYSEKIWKMVLARLEKIIPPEIFGRIGKENVVVCNFLSQGEMAEVLELQIKKLEERVKNCAKPFKLFIREDAKQFLLDETQDKINISFGARAILNVFKKRIENPFSSLLSKDEDEGGIVKGDIVEVRLKESGGKKKLEFTRQTAKN